MLDYVQWWDGGCKCSSSSLRTSWKHLPHSESSPFGEISPLLGLHTTPFLCSLYHVPFPMFCSQVFIWRKSLLCFLCTNVPQNLLWSSVSFPSHTQKVQRSSGDSSFCLSITDAQDNKIIHLLFSALNIHLACTMFCEHYLDYKFLIKLKGRIQKIHQNDSRKQPQSKLQVADSQCFEAREYLWSYKAR